MRWTDDDLPLCSPSCSEGVALQRMFSKGVALWKAKNALDRTENRVPRDEAQLQRMLRHLWRHTRRK